MRLTEIARACKAAARAVMLYPPGHPAIGSTLGRIVHATSRELLTAPLVMTVLPDGLMIDDRAPARIDAAIAELAALLHSHLIGKLTVHPGGDLEAWRMFLLLLGRTPESVRVDGGISRIWTTMAGRHLDIEEIDYASVLRERSAGDSAVWDNVIANCLQGSVFELDENAIGELIELAGSAERLNDLLATIETRAEAGSTMGAKTAAVMRMLRGIIEVVSKNAPEQVEPVLRRTGEADGSRAGSSERLKR